MKNSRSIELLSAFLGVSGAVTILVVGCMAKFEGKNNASVTEVRGQDESTEHACARRVNLLHLILSPTQAQKNAIQIQTRNIIKKKSLS